MSKCKNAFPIKKKLDAIEWKLELLRASVANTHTPLRTMKSMVHTDILQLTQNLKREIIDSLPRQMEVNSPDTARENAAKHLVWQNRHL